MHDRLEIIEKPPHAFGQRFVSGVLAGELGVAAVRRHLAREQHRAHRRLGEVGGVGMPDAAEVLALVLELLHLDDLRKALDALHERVLDRLSMYCAKAMNCAGVSGWSWKKRTWCSRKARRISATASGDSPAARSTASISAPSAPAMRLTFKLLYLDVRFAHDFAVARLLGAQDAIISSGVFATGSRPKAR